MLIFFLIIPIITIFSVFFCKKKEEIQLTTLGFSFINLIHTLFIIYKFKGNISIFEFIFYGKLGQDGLSIWQIQLISIQMPIIILSTWKSIKGNLNNYKFYIILQFFITFWSYAVFLVQDILYFYISFEGVQIPMYFLIGFFGGRNRKSHAANLFFIYTLLGSLFQLLSLIILYLETGTSDYHIILNIPISIFKQYFQWLAFFFALAIKIPMIPMHIWLPEAHVEAPTAASVMLAAILLKQGSYGLLRYCLTLFPIASSIFTPFVSTLCIIGIIYSSFACLSLLDMKKLIAYSSIGHMNIATLAIFTNDLNGLNASIYFLISHGIISSALFLLIGVLYDRYHTRTVKYYKGLVQIMPLFSLFFLFFTFANIAVPGTSGFICEFLTFLAAFNLNPFIGIFSSLAIIQTPAYSLWFFHKIVYGKFSPSLIILFSDISFKEFIILSPLVFFTLFLGLFPNYLFLPIQISNLNLLYLFSLFYILFIFSPSLLFLISFVILYNIQ